MLIEAKRTLQAMLLSNDHSLKKYNKKQRQHQFKKHKKKSKHHQVLVQTKAVNSKPKIKSSK